MKDDVLDNDLIKKIQKIEEKYLINELWIMFMIY